MNEKIINKILKEEFTENPCDDFQIINKKIVCGEKTKYKQINLLRIFNSLCANSSLAVLDSSSGLFCYLACDSKISKVYSIPNSKKSADINKDISKLLEQNIEIINESLIIINDENIYVNKEYKNKFNALYIPIKFYWNYYKFMKNIDETIKTFSYFTTNILMFDFYEDYSKKDPPCSLSDLSESVSKLYKYQIYDSSNIFMCLEKYEN